MRVYLLVLAVAAAVTYLTTPLARRLAQRVGAVTAVRARDVHTVPTPRLGGVAMVAGLGCALLFASRTEFLGAVFDDTLPWAILVCATALCLLGVADDIWDLDWVTKLIGQILVAGVLAWQGVALVTLPIFGLTIGSDRLILFATVLVVVIAINAVNWVDGLDGLAAGVIAIGGSAFFVYTYLLTRNNNPTDYSDLATVVIAALVGACLGFLPHNFHPARIFMGDSGAMPLGMTIAAASIVVTGQIDPAVLESRQALPAFVPIVLPVAVLLLPLLDVAVTSLRRLMKGKSPFHADRTHLHHKLLDRGHSHRRAVAIMYLWTTVVSFSAAALVIFPVPQVLMGAAIGAVLATVITVVPIPTPSFLKQRTAGQRPS
ncbi:undecaprenyl/decaprenyl-phosphate alpha-N-acetylglucosaminyl 1-phosphate transferase [Ruania alkalisoli]|uniref:Undecaprenyl/decaprenyl-phosphate alpha-N-acetylglucosaminyl 1-phosphate transferase n=1 Tax=Ruania alkalisoli TaxID=2779775 RepID=A0A7M1SQE7_9MICO|nr:MraY family glycosyltransferase [Ruania alkalisoli]QOR69661.1 undecaprenyl/decaprenyl-phosphate alpha-N-acetylglucosaminyl 1-phosphate transferase [Ruania alkalisoli]